MTLEDCTKDELIAIIKRFENGNTHFGWLIDNILSEMALRKVMEMQAEADKAFDEGVECRRKACEVDGEEHMRLIKLSDKAFEKSARIQREMKDVKNG